MTAVGGMQYEAGIGDRGEDAAPGFDRDRAVFAEVIQAAEGDEVVCRGGESVYFRGVGRGLIAPVGFGEADGSFGIEFVGSAGGIEVGIGDAIVDCVEASGAGVSEISCLHRRGFAGEEGHAVVGHVHCEIDQDVDAVIAD